MPRNEQIEARWVEWWNQVYELIRDSPDLHGRRDVPFQLPDFSIVSQDDFFGWLQESAYAGNLVEFETGWIGHRRGIVATASPG